MHFVVPMLKHKSLMQLGAMEFVLSEVRRKWNAPGLQCCSAVGSTVLLHACKFK